MTLQELHDQLAPAFPDYARKNLKTAVCVLARALDCPDPAHCQLDHFYHPLPTLYDLVERFLFAQGKKPENVRNLKNYLSRLFRLAEAQHLFSLRPAELLPLHDPNHKPRRPGSDIGQQNGTSLPYAQWSVGLQNAFADFRAWATAPLVPQRPASLRKRNSTVDTYRQRFESYFGYLTHIQHLVPTFDHLFDLSLIRAYVQWHINDCHHRPTTAIHLFLQRVLTLTNQYRPLPELKAELRMLKQTIPIPPPHYDKEDAWVSLATLEEIGRGLWPRKQPHEIKRDNHKHPKRQGVLFAVHAGLSLMLRLWVYRPYRQRNMREMQLGTNLYKDTHGTWRLRFSGDQLKIATKRGRPNVLDQTFPLTLVPLLEDYFATWRPLLVRHAAHPDQERHVFLTQFGTPYTATGIHSMTRSTVYRYTGKHWHPHMIRTVWATEQIQKGLDFLDVAKMLNDKLETVIARYAHLRDEDVTEKADRLIEERNGQDT
jgi:hypothetical protein